MAKGDIVDFTRKLYLDDVRNPPGLDWVLFRNVTTLKNYIINILEGDLAGVFLSLDHDLGEGTESGYDFLTWLESEVVSGGVKNLNPDNIEIHSANPAGRRYMALTIQSLRRILRA